MLDTFEIVVTAFSVMDQANQLRFFEETFLVTNVSPEVVFGMPFLILSGLDVNYLDWELQWRTYTTKEAFLTTKRIKLVSKKEFVAVAFNSEYETYVVYVGLVSSNALPSSFLLKLNVYPFRRPQIYGLIAEKAPTKVPAKYLDFADVFFLDLASELPKHSRINDHAIKLVHGCQ